MNTTELRTQDEAGLAKEIKDLQRRETRRSIARAKTILAQKQAAK